MCMHYGFVDVPEILGLLVLQSLRDIDLESVEQTGQVDELSQKITQGVGEGHRIERRNEEASQGVERSS
jgi:hypothetical protein